MPPRLAPLMARFLLKRLGLAVITLFLLSVIAFAAAQLLPGDIGRNVLGPFADQHSVDLYNHQHGVDRPAYVQYADWISHFVRGDFGESLQYTGYPSRVSWARRLSTRSSWLRSRSSSSSR